MGLDIKGISYAIEDAPADVVRRNLRVIAEELHCTTVMLIGADTEEHIAAAQSALDIGLDVYLRPYYADKPRADLLAHLARTAAAAEQLRARHPGRVTLLLGSEFSLTSPGMIPGSRVFVRLQVLVRPRLRRLFDRRITRKLNALLADALATSRRRFRGQITYAAGAWERVDWSGFDLIGVNLYRSGTDRAAYQERLGTLTREADKPVIITEFGCGAHVGANERGPGSFRIVRWFSDQPHIKDGHLRDEGTQAAYLTELIDLYATHGVHGCFVYTFALPHFPHHADDPRQDLDMAGFGVVKVQPGDVWTWQPKEAFHQVAHRYANL